MGLRQAQALHPNTPPGGWCAWWHLEGAVSRLGRRARLLGRVGLNPYTEANGMSRRGGRLCGGGSVAAVRDEFGSGVCVVNINVRALRRSLQISRVQGQGCRGSGRPLD